MPRVLVGIATCAIGFAAIYIFAWDQIKELGSSFAPTRSVEKASPYSVLEGSVIRIEPYNATFAIPESWLTPHPVPTPSKNLHLSYQELNQLYWNDGSDAEDAQVMNSVLPFSECAAHFGDRGWGNYLWNDLQGRLYVVNIAPEQLSKQIKENGLQEALRVFEAASTNTGNYKDWQRDRLEITDAPTHFILMKRLDFVFKAFGDRTVVFVFLHAGGFDHTMEDIVDSFEWPNPNPIHETRKVGHS